MQWFRVGLKTFLGFAVPNQYCPVVTKQIMGEIFRARNPKPS